MKRADTRERPGTGEPRSGSARRGSPENARSEREEIPLLASARAGWRSGAPLLTAPGPDSRGAARLKRRGLLNFAGHYTPMAESAWTITPAGLAALAAAERTMSRSARAPQGAGGNRPARFLGSAQNQAGEALAERGHGMETKP